MSGRILLVLWLLGLAIVSIVAVFQNSPGYMDADYYYSGGIQLASGQGFNENILWNYLDDPEGLPHPSHGYWMPLVSILAAAGMALLGKIDFSSGRFLFILIAAFIPPLTAELAWRLHRRKDLALISGGLALFPAFYLPYLPTTDVFGCFMILGGCFFLLLTSIENSAQRDPRDLYLSPLLLGSLAGLMHLGRADGLLWLFLGLAGVGRLALDAQRPRAWRRALLVGLACLVGYLLVMGPWYLRNLAVFGAPLSPGGDRSFWILEYDELFTFPADQLTFQRWLQSGLGVILNARLWAAGQNLQSGLAVQGGIFLAPLIGFGLWRLRNHLSIRVAVCGWLLTFLAMTLVFPYQGARGGFFHSGAAFQPVFWAAAPLGLESLIEWGSRRRNWETRQARRIFGVGLMGLAFLLTILTARGRLFSADAGGVSWNARYERYVQLEQYLQKLDIPLDGVAIVNNPPEYFVASGRPAISIPYGDLQAVCSAADRYHGRVLLLEIDQILGGTDLFDHPKDRLCLKYLDTIEDVRIFLIEEP